MEQSHNTSPELPTSGLQCTRKFTLFIENLTFIVFKAFWVSVTQTSSNTPSWFLGKRLELVVRRLVLF